MESELLELMCDTITYEAVSGSYSDRGQPTYDASVSLPCRIEPVSGEEVIRSESGETRKASWRIYVGTTSTTVRPDGRITLPTGFQPQVPPFFAVGREADEYSSHHQVLLV